MRALASLPVDAGMALTPTLDLATKRSAGGQGKARQGDFERPVGDLGLTGGGRRVSPGTVGRVGLEGRGDPKSGAATLGMSDFDVEVRASAHGLLDDRAGSLHGEGRGPGGAWRSEDGGCGRSRARRSAPPAPQRHPRPATPGIRAVGGRLRRAFPRGGRRADRELRAGVGPHGARGPAGRCSGRRARSRPSRAGIARLRARCGATGRQVREEVPVVLITVGVGLNAG